MTDLERIRRDLLACRDIPWSCSCVEPEQLAALVEEVERLRADNAELELGVAMMRVRMNNAYQQRNDERAAVVAWLRAECGSPGHEERFCAYCNVRRNIAADIERGEHRREREPVEDDSIEYRDIGKED